MLIELFLYLLAADGDVCSFEEEDSIWLYDILETIGFNEEFRQICKRSSIMNEILFTYGAEKSEKSNKSNYTFGSMSEATYPPGECYL